MNIRDWLQIGRMHTSAAETGLLLIIAYLAHVPPVYWPFYLLFGLLYHFVGFGYNSLFDYEKYDRYDDNKAHHPLNRGVLKPDGVMRVLNSFMVVGVLFFFGLWLLNSYHEAYSMSVLTISFIIFVVGIILGFAYNLYSKLNKIIAGLTISFSYAMIALSIYMISGGTLNNSIMLVIAWIIFYILFQIWIGGEAKDITNEHEKNLLRDMGCKAHQNGKLIYSIPAMGFFLLLASMKIVLNVAILGIPQPPRIIMLVPILAILVLYPTILFATNGHRQLLKVLGAGEALSYIAFALAVTANPIYILIFVLVPVVVFILLNRIMWNTWISPMV